MKSPVKLGVPLTEKSLEIRIEIFEQREVAQLSTSL